MMHIPTSDWRSSVNIPASVGRMSTNEAVVSDWPDVPEDVKQLIIEGMGKGWQASKQHDGPLVMIHASIRPEDHLPAEVVKRLDDCHDGRTTIVCKDKMITIWYHTVGITL